MGGSDESIRAMLAREQAGGRGVVRGWLRTVRHAKGVSFLDVSDGSCMAGMQVVASPETEGYDPVVRELSTGSAVEAEGEVVDSPGKGQRFELHATKVTLVGEAGDDYPLQKKRHSFEFLRTIAHLRPRTNTIGAVLRVRNAAAMAIHEFFQREEFVYLHTPIITASDAEGAGEMFRVTSLPLGDPPRDVQGAVDDAQDFFGRPTFLTVSGQLEAEIGALALSRVYTFGPTFRAENSNTARHLAEFWMVEPEAAFCNLEGLADLAERFLKSVFQDVLDRCEEDMAFFEKRVESQAITRMRTVVDEPFERIPYREAVGILERSGQAFEFPVGFGLDLQSEHERWLTEQHVGRPVIVTDWPAAIKAFYMYRNDDGETVGALDVLVGGVGEIIGGSQREHRHGVLEETIRGQGLDPADYWWYLDLRRFGSVPHAGFGLGFERIVQFMTGMANIRDVIPFPRVPGQAEF
jgi:asparaginyl-tRNA synthetase